jgi:hypothetical protein
MTRTIFETECFNLFLGKIIGFRNLQEKLGNKREKIIDDSLPLSMYCP